MTKQLSYLSFFFVVKEDTLLDMVNHMTEKTALVHQMPFTSDRSGFAATLEKVTIYRFIHLLARSIAFQI